MITEDAVMRLLERADPARRVDATPTVDAAGYLDALRTRRRNVNEIDIEPTPTEPPTNRHRWVAAAAAATVAIIAGGLVLAARADDETGRASDGAAVTEPGPDATEAPMTTSPPPPVDDTAAAEAEHVVTGFLDAWGAFDADAATAYLTDAAIAEMDSSALQRSGADTREEFRLLVRLMEAMGYQETIRDCEPPRQTDAGVSIHCSFDFHAIRSDEIGLGPYRDNYWELTVRDGEIVSAMWYQAVLSNGFSVQMWEPFQRWVTRTHPDDVPLMYDDPGQVWRVSEDSIRLWEQHSRGYVASRPISARVDEICTAAHDRLDAELAAAGVELTPSNHSFDGNDNDVDLVAADPEDRDAYIEAAARVLDETLPELGALVAPEDTRAEFERVYSLVARLPIAWRDPGTAPVAPDIIHQIENQFGFYECTFEAGR